jgi:hypothetical protein
MEGASGKIIVNNRQQMEVTGKLVVNQNNKLAPPFKSGC